MNDKHYIGKRVSTFEAYNSIGPISGIALLVDDRNEIFAGSDEGYVLEVSCPYGTQAIANSLLEQLEGKTYQGYRSDAAELPFSAELGDGISVNGIYSMLAYRSVNFGPGHFSEIAAPATNELEHEYPYLSREQRQIERKIAVTQSLITKTAEEIQLEIVGIEDAFSEMELTLDSLSARIQDAEGNIGELELTTEEFRASINSLEGDYAEIALTLDGLTVTDSSGTTKIKGNSVETDTLYVKAANITGTLTADQIAMSGAITWNDLSSGVQSTINAAYNSGGVSEDQVTVITQNAIRTASISANQISAGTLNASSISLNGLFTLKSGSATYGYMGVNTSKGGPVLCDPSMSVFVVATSNAAKLSYAENYMIWVTSAGCYSNDTMKVYSDRRLKHDISYDLEKEELLFAALKPCSFSRNGDELAKKHWGFVAQDFIESAEAVGFDPDTLAVLGCDNGMNTIGYGEVTALNTYMIQKILKALANEGINV